MTRLNEENKNTCNKDFLKMKISVVMENEKMYICMILYFGAYNLIFCVRSHISSILDMKSTPSTLLPCDFLTDFTS